MRKDNYIFRNLVFEGGGIKGIAYAGTLEVLQRKGILKNVIRVAGTSAGAITATLLAIGFNVEEIKAILTKTDFSEFKDDSFFTPLNIISLFRQYGWYKGKVFKKWLENVISQKIDKDTTFSQLLALREQKRTRELYVIGADVNNRKEVIFSHETHPDMKIVDAVRISMSIPLFFRAITNKEQFFVDGGIYYNYPLNLFDEEKYLFDKKHGIFDKDNKKLYNKETLGLRVDTPEEISRHLYKVPQSPKKITSLREYIGTLIGSLIDIANKRHLEEFDWHRTIYINSLGIGTTQFVLTDAQKIELIESGKKGTEIYFEWFDSPAKDEAKPLNK